MRTWGFKIFRGDVTHALKRLSRETVKQDREGKLPKPGTRVLLRKRKRGVVSIY
jgi:hypothetical protein